MRSCCRPQRLFGKSGSQTFCAKNIRSPLHHDDHDFDEIGVVFVNRHEVPAIQDLKRTTSTMLDSVGDSDDRDFVEHVLWPQVRQTAAVLNGIPCYIRPKNTSAKEAGDA